LNATETKPSHWFTTGPAIVAGLAAVKLLVHLYTGRHYGYFIDELYYLACAQHLAWGYVDQAPLIAFVANFVRMMLGNSLPAIRLLPALAGAGLVFLTGSLARELGGGRFAQGLAALAVLAAPGNLAIDNFLSMNAFEPLFWMGCALVLVRIIKTGNEKLWLWFGVLAGIGLENKHSMLIFGFALTVGLLLTPQRKIMRSPWFWMAGALAFLIFLPNLIWNIQHHFPFLELQANIRSSGRNTDLPPWRMFTEETLAMLPLSLPIWLGGLWFFLFTRAAKPMRVLGYAFVITAVIIMALDPRIYYLFPAFPLLMAGGGALWEELLAAPRWTWLRVAYPALIALMAIALAPLAVPALTPAAYIRYTQATHLQQPRIENHALGPLPQIFADQFGWEEMAQVVAHAYNALPADVRASTAIFAQNYGQAATIDFFGPRYGLPPAISGHQSYFLWGPRGYTGESMIVLDDRQKHLEELFTSVEKVGHVDHTYSMPYEHFDVFYCRGLKQPLSELWPQMKKWN
jgi:Dolichyl-phosphate-mannose-protein mannosyltransferase